MLKYSSFRDFPFNEIDHVKKSKYITNKYQKYFDKFNTNINDELYLENLRILKDHYNESTYTIKTKYKFTKEILNTMINYLEPEYFITEIIDSWLGERQLNEYNINDGKSEWLIKVKTKINLSLLDHFGGSYSTVDFLLPKYTPEYVLRFDKLNDKFKVPINIIINGKLYDKIWYYSDKANISIDEIYLYIKYYIKKNLTNEFFIKNIMMTKDGWIVII